MKIPSTQQAREADAYTILHEPITSINLMERAASACVEKIISLFDKTTSFTVFCGMGNNGGDGLAISRMLLEHGYNCKIYVVKHTTHFSEDCQTNLKRFQKTYLEKIKELNTLADLSSINTDVVIDAVLGSGLNKPVREGLLADLFERINRSNKFIFAVDIPSGLFAQSKMPQNAIAVKADYVLTFEFPKLSFLFPETYEYAGEWSVADIGLHPDFINKIETPFYYSDSKDIKPLLKVREKFSHKGDYGKAFLIAGSKSMMGAAVLNAKACLRSGAGIVYAQIPQAGYEILQTCVNEAIAICDQEAEHFSSPNMSVLEKCNAIGIGSGLGTHSDSAKGLKHLIGSVKIPIVFDADAINLLAENKTWLEFLPKRCVFTPHLKEFERLAGKTTDSFQRLEVQQEFSKKHACTVVLKGAHTSVSLPDGRVFFNSTGNPGMATAGSGDVLTGIITGLIAQNYAPEIAAVLGVYLHGKAADIAIGSQSYESLTATDIINHLGEAFLVEQSF